MWYKEIIRPYLERFLIACLLVFDCILITAFFSTLPHAFPAGLQIHSLLFSINLNVIKINIKNRHKNVKVATLKTNIIELFK